MIYALPRHQHRGSKSSQLELELEYDYFDGRVATVFDIEEFFSSLKLMLSDREEVSCDLQH